MPQWALSFFIALGVVLVITPAVIFLADKTGAVDKPDARKVHTKPIPRIGGIGIFLAFTVAIIFITKVSNFEGETLRTIIGLIISGSLMFLVGIIDDYKNLPAKVKLLGQIIAAAVLVVGVSGLAAVTILLVAMEQHYFLITILTAGLAGAAFGFLFYNTNPARIFMGDSGSLFLGFMLASISIVGVMKSTAIVALIVPILALGIPIMDTTFAILRRYLGGQPIFKPDKGHLHHRLLSLGFTQRQAVFLMYIISAVLGMSAIALTEVNAQIAILILAVVVSAIFFGAKKLGILTLANR